MNINKKDIKELHKHLKKLKFKDLSDEEKLKVCREGQDKIKVLTSKVTKEELHKNFKKLLDVEKNLNFLEEQLQRVINFKKKMGYD